MSVFAGARKAPEFPPDLDWLNTYRPLRMSELRGKVVLLDVYTSCCVHCLHVLPDLRRLAAKYPRELVVIGVHSPKYHTERETETIRRAILRDEIPHPVVNDHDLLVWRAYDVRRWPTLVLINPQGEIVGRMSGEDVFDVLDEAILQMLSEFDARRMVNRAPLELRPEATGGEPSFLSFPGKVLADEFSGRLFISDTNHHRIVMVSLATGEVTGLIGCGAAGFVDGNFEMARFDHPQGMALDGETLYVADAGNHALRRVDLSRRTVTTIAGTGRQARQPNLSGPGERTALNSPWDLAVHRGLLYIAMAGSHQVWRMDLRSGAVQPHAGVGREARVDGPLPDAALAQPSGLTTDGRRLYVADSESSAIRAVDLDEEGVAETIVGGDLFEFGDRDGQGREVRLQHPLDLTYHRGFLYVADTYNHKIKRVSPEDGVAETLVGAGEAGLRDGESAQFHEPSGLCAAGDALYIADTNNHVLRRVDLPTRRVTTVQINA